MLTKYRSVLSVPGASRLFVTGLLGRLPLGTLSLAILLLVRGATHSYAAAGVAVGAEAFASAAAAPIQGRLIDRFGRRRVLPPTVLVQGAILLLLVLSAGAHAGTVALVVLAGLTGAFLPPISPSVRALLREVVHDPAVRETAYALDSVIQELVWITGPLLVALVVAVGSPSAAVLVSAAIGIVGTLLFVSTPLARGRGRDVAGPERTAALANPELRALLIPITLTGMGLGAIEVGLPSLALHAGSRSASGLLLALWSVGSVIGGLWYGSRAWSSSLAYRYRTLLTVAIVCSAPLIAARSIPAGLICAALAGLTIAPVFSCQYALVGRAATGGAETEAFSWVSAALVAGLAAGSALGGAAISAAGVSAPFVISCAATALAAAMAVTVRDRLAQPA